MAEPKYNIKCGHCGATFESSTFLHIELCDNCFQLGHRGNTGACWKCRSDYYSADEPFAARDDD